MKKIKVQTEFEAKIELNNEIRIRIETRHNITHS